MAHIKTPIGTNKHTHANSNRSWPLSHTETQNRSQSQSKEFLLVCCCFISFNSSFPLVRNHSDSWLKVQQIWLCSHLSAQAIKSHPTHTRTHTHILTNFMQICLRHSQYALKVCVFPALCAGKSNCSRGNARATITTIRRIRNGAGKLSKTRNMMKRRVELL